MNKLALAIHGGAGTIHRSEMTPELEIEYRNELRSALEAGWSFLTKKGSAVDAVEAAVVRLEDFPLFNAGRGSVFTHAGKNEMDACIMDGANLRSGAVAFVSNIRNPISLARLVMTATEHCLLAGHGATEFAHEHGIKFEPDEYFFTEHRWRQLQTAIAENRIELDHSDSRDSKNSIHSEDSGDSDDSRARSGSLESMERLESLESLESMNSLESPKSLESLESLKSVNRKSQIANRKSRMGTVGAVACDANGNLAAATSTGGMTNKKFGRVGDSCVIGAGTYAENSTCAASCTGHGEYFMLGVTAFDIAARMKYRNLGLADAARETLQRLTEIGGEGGFIAVDRFGNVVMPFNSEGMYRASICGDGAIEISIYK